MLGYPHRVSLLCFVFSKCQAVFRRTYDFGVEDITSATLPH